MALTGAEYLASLRDGREVWIDGERVDDVPAHPGFRTAARNRCVCAASHIPGWSRLWPT